MGFLSGLGDMIFGKEASVDKSTDPIKTKEQLDLLSYLATSLKNNPDLMKQVTGAYEKYTGQLAPDLAPLEKTSLAALEQTAMNAASPDKNLTAARDAITRAVSGDKPNIDTFNTYFKGAVEDPMLKAFREQVIPELTRRFSGSAAFGSDRLTAEKNATSQLSDSLSSSRASSFFDYLKSAQDRAVAAAQIAPSLYGQETDTLLKTLAAGGTARENQDLQLTRAYQEFLRGQGAGTDVLNQAIALLGINPIENTTVVKPGQEGLLQTAAKGFGAYLGGKFLS